MPAVATAAQYVTDAQRRAFREDGFFILPGVMSKEDLAMVRRECDAAVAEVDAQSTGKPGNKPGGSLSANGKYFITQRSRKVPELERFIFRDLMADICRATIGDDSFLFHEQFVVKGPEKGGGFAWHQDSGYIGHPHRPYLTCWCALDDCTVENGTVSVLPYGRSGVREMVEHVWSEQESARIGYHGDDPGDPAIVPAGSIVVFSSLLFHRSGVNSSDRSRRAYVVQYSPEIIRKTDGVTPWGLSDPFLKNGQRVAKTTP
jgi:ectoine hydroxylase-related dioxygenase (phytanoyl-CoA dioxygenase family)